MSSIAFQITCVSIVYFTVCSGTDQRKHQSSESLVTGELSAQRASNAENASTDLMTASYRGNGIFDTLYFADDKLTLNKPETQQRGQVPGIAYQLSKLT